MKHTPNGEILLAVTTYDRHEAVAHPPMVRLKVVQSFDLMAWDCARAKPLGVSGFCCPRTGDWITYGTRYRALSRVGEDILDVLQLNPGIRYDKGMLYQATGHEVLAGADAHTHVYRLRRAHGELKDTEHFIRTDAAGLFWPADLSWIRVVPAS